MELLIALAVIAVFVIIVVVRSIKIVPQARAAVVERLGRYSRTLSPGLALLIPFVDRVRATIDLREQVISFPPQPVITADNLQVGIDTVVYFQVTDPRLAVYGIANYIHGMEQLTTTTLRNVVGGLSLEGALTGRDGINTQLRTVLDGTTGPWGLRVARVEIKAIEPPLSIQDSMERQMRADREKRAVILTAEGERESSIKKAEGQKVAQILSAEGQKQAAILGAEAGRQSQILQAEGERAAQFLTAQGQAKAIETVFEAIHRGKPDSGLLAYQYLQTLPQIAQGDANKVWIVPSEFSRALDGLANMTGAEDKKSWMDVEPGAPADGSDGRAGQKIDTQGWFDSNLPPAAEQPEAKFELSESIDSGLPVPPMRPPASPPLGGGAPPPSAQQQSPPPQVQQGGQTGPSGEPGQPPSDAPQSWPPPGQPGQQ